ncbi:MAG: NAD-dependent deacetylase [Magnetococcales bacterium]|nr:NAD-dependent deacetylase [Magnetococcales bacterium]
MSDHKIQQVAQLISDADALLITAGAGMGVDSGLPDFRGNEGFWNAYPPMRKLGLSFVDMANPGWFEQDPALAWGFYGHRMALYRATQPHAGFALLKSWGLAKKESYFVFTSNVDGQFQLAGFPEGRIEECHGSIHHLQCVKPCSNAIWSAEGIDVSVNPETFRAEGDLPRCPSCGALARPNILMFGDWDWIAERSSAQAVRLKNWIATVHSRQAKLAVIEMGAGGAVPTVRQFSEQMAQPQGNYLIRINPRDTEVPLSRHMGLAMGSVEALERISIIY